METVPSMQRSATRSPWQNLILVGLALFVTVPMALAQTNTAQMTGVVRDSSGGVLPGATVIAIQQATGTVVERVTDGEGRFFLPEMSYSSCTKSHRTPETK